ncbi:Conjugal transfer protein TraI [Sphingobium herbicidovorans NBRC 16415]|uniref:Conjugal transfer protein TraI n=1 Tax=Sphingobium herbicidovorans (strain ATCC 700291 / DSM 11019 / CCUG 56400 / KCTC 2939 / LMG 18315 / NBRC 16415 / MH) TaxID=1219045 RepID=A0A086P5F2_SPHHM|nr:MULTISPECIES: relaxase/mobilization nuclease RlxS [Sphingomonadaceae]KFG88620.1 Conjugal transfer protein TraI [Sphingobium herbicidovorans NBRC 16415]
MSGDEEDFEPRLGKMRSTRGKKARKYLGRLLAAGVAAAGAARAGRKGFDGSRISRGSAAGRLLASRGSSDRFAARRVVVKTRLVRLGGKGLDAARAHLKYIQRDGVTRDGAPGQLYGPQNDAVDGKDFLGSAVGDRHQFRFIVSAEEGDLYADLKPFVRRLMAQMEEDLGTRLDWVAVDHFNTGHPHSHIMLRGRDDRGKDLIIARDYIAHGLRTRASEIATLDLGPKTRLEVETRMRRDVDAARLTDIDRDLLREAERQPLVMAIDRDPVSQSIRAGRLQKLGTMGLADEIAPGQWRLAKDLRETLTGLGERGDIIRMMQRELTARSRTAAPGDRVVHDGRSPLTEPLVGRFVARALDDELADRHYLIVDGIDGASHYVAIGKGDAVETLPEGAIVRIVPAVGATGEADRTIVAVAAANDGRYDAAAHRRFDSRASPAFIEAHIRRLEAMRRQGLTDRTADGSWTIAADHAERARAHATASARERPVTVELLSPVPVERLARAEARTWLDREAASGGTLPVRDKGFGREVRTAIALRQQWLIDEELADAAGEGISYRRGALAVLQRRELLRLARSLSAELGKAFVETSEGERVEGRLARRIDAAGGRYALVEKAKQFTLVPWKPVLDRHVGKDVGGVVRESGISWTIGRGRGGPTIS